jgi:hypothetical protein
VFAAGEPEEVVMHRIVVVTPAGRRKYLDVLKHYILNDYSIDAWHLWDNCRSEADRRYIYELERISPKISIISIKGSDGSNASVNRFYTKCRDPDVFYIKMDDDIVYLPKNFLAGNFITKRSQRKINTVGGLLSLSITLFAPGSSNIMGAFT